MEIYVSKKIGIPLVLATIIGGIVAGTEIIQGVEGLEENPLKTAIFDEDQQDFLDKTADMTKEHILHPAGNEIKNIGTDLLNSTIEHIDSTENLTQEHESVILGSIDTNPEQWLISSLALATLGTVIYRKIQYEKPELDVFERHRMAEKILAQEGTQTHRTLYDIIGEGGTWEEASEATGKSTNTLRRHFSDLLKRAIGKNSDRTSYEKQHPQLTLGFATQLAYKNILENERSHLEKLKEANTNGEIPNLQSLHNKYDKQNGYPIDELTLLEGWIYLGYENGTNLKDFAKILGMQQKSIEQYLLSAKRKMGVTDQRKGTEWTIREISRKNTLLNQLHTLVSDTGLRYPRKYYQEKLGVSKNEIQQLIDELIKHNGFKNTKLAQEAFSRITQSTKNLAQYIYNFSVNGKKIDTKNLIKAMDLPNDGKFINNELRILFEKLGIDKPKLNRGRKSDTEKVLNNLNSDEIKALKNFFTN